MRARIRGRLLLASVPIHDQLLSGSEGRRKGEGYLEGPERVFDIRNVPENSDDCHVENDYAKCYSLRVVDGEAAAEDEVLC